MAIGLFANQSAPTSVYLTRAEFIESLGGHNGQLALIISVASGSPTFSLQLSINLDHTGWRVIGANTISTGCKLIAWPTPNPHNTPIADRSINILRADLTISGGAINAALDYP